MQIKCFPNSKLFIIDCINYGPPDIDNKIPKYQIPEVGGSLNLVEKLRFPIILKVYLFSN